MSFSFSSLFFEKKALMIFTTVGLVVSILFSLIDSLKYSSTTRLLIRQDLETSIDAYTASRSEERIADNLATIVYTTTFFDQVMQSGFSINKAYFPDDDSKRRNLWKKTLDVSVAHGTGLLTITAYHPDIAQAEQLVRAVASVLETHTKEYTSGTGILVKLIDAPLNSSYPVKPNIPLNAFSGVVFGFLVGSFYVLVKQERLRRRHQL